MTQSLLVVTSIHDDFDKRIWRHAVSMSENGYKVHLVCPWVVEHGQDYSGVILQPFKRVEKRIQRPYQIPFRAWKKLRPLIDEVDIVHFHDIDLLPWMAILALFKPVVYDVHENYADEMLVRDWIPYYLRRPLYWMVNIGQYLLSRVVRNVVLVTKAQEEDFSSRYINKIIVRNYASLKLMDDAADNYLTRSPVVIFPGSQYENNGTLLLLDIALLTKEKIPGIKFCISDAFESERFRERFIRELKFRELDDMFEIMPMVPSSEVIKLLNRATIAINPVLRVRKQLRAINTKLFEFMAAGIPFISSDLPYPTELVRDTKAGLLAQPESPESFSEQICRLHHDKTLAISLGQNGQRAFTARYSWESQMPALKHYYENILSPESVVNSSGERK
jgi:glycosyltransferase involved in cell wall biosynthesis